MKLFTVKQIAEIDRHTIKNEPVSSSVLMERAATALFSWIAGKTSYRSFTVFAGYGNNGGDGLVIARLLVQKGFVVNVFILESDRYSPDFSLNLTKLKGLCKIEVFKGKGKSGYINECIIDALFGSGLSRPLEGIARTAVQTINGSGKPVISIDVPSGLLGEGSSDPTSDSIIKACVTLSLQFPKLAFFFSENREFTGEWHIIPIGLHPDAIEKTASPYYYILAEDIKELILLRDKFGHKGNYGHALIFSGSNGKFGAGVLAARACIHSGAGLTTVFSYPQGMSVFQSAVPEAMGIFSETLPDLSLFSAVAAGPGIGTGLASVSLLTELLSNVKAPLVLDADALNILSENKELLTKIPAGAILTPHPKEFMRLSGESFSSSDMLEKAVVFAKELNVIIVLKGAYTRVITPDGRIHFNSTGNPGMAKGGSGDVLTGIIVSLLARGYSPENAAITGVFLHGHAGDLASSELTQEYVSAGDIISYLCRSFKSLYSL